MGYRVELARYAQKQLAVLDRNTLLLVSSFIDQELDGCDNPCALPSAKKLQGTRSGWRWRIGIYRMLGTVDDGRLVIELFKIAHRREVDHNL